MRYHLKIKNTRLHYEPERWVCTALSLLSFIPCAVEDVILELDVLELYACSLEQGVSFVVEDELLESQLLFANIFSLIC